MVCESPKIQLHTTIEEKEYPIGAHLMIPPKVLMIHDIRIFYYFPIQDPKKFEMNEAYDSLCDKEHLKPKHQYLEAKGLTHIRDMPKKFQMK